MVRKWKGNSYILSICLLISEYVRQQQHDSKRILTSQASVTSVDDASVGQPPVVMSKRSLNALARFLIREIQHPRMTASQRLTSLYQLLQRLEIDLNDTKDFQHLSWQLVRSLTKIESPEAVWNTLEQIGESVAPLPSSRADEEVDVDSASSTLIRKSLLGVYVRSFLLAVNRLLFDGLSRLFDDVQYYLEQFREDMEREKNGETRSEEKCRLELAGSPASAHLWNDSKEENEELPLSPIQSRSVTPFNNIRQSHGMTLASTKLDPLSSVKQVQTVEINREVNDSAVWSNDQFNYFLSDMMREMEGKRNNSRPDMQRTDDFWTDDQLRLLQNTMHRSNLNVLFVRYLSFLRDRDYQGALDSLHQYHDALSPRQDQSLNDSDGNDGNKLPSAPSQIVGSHFRGNGLQYAALNLAGLQITFDHFNAAHESIQEAIRVAQHHGDHICVAFALAWMIRINQKVGATKENIRQLVGSSLDRSKELRLPALQVLATLTEVEGELMRCSTTSRPGSASHLMSHVVVIRVPSPRPLHIWSRLYEAAQSIISIATPSTCSLNNSSRTVNALQAQLRAKPDPSDRPCANGVDWAKSTDALLDNVWKLSGKVTLCAVAGWSLFGQRSLAEVFSRMHLLCYNDTACIGEVAIMVSQMAMSNLAKTKSGEIVYVQALEFLVDVAAGGVNAKEQQYLLREVTFQRTMHHLFFSWALERGELLRAEVHLNAMLALSPEGNDFSAYLEALFCKAKLRNAAGDYTESLEMLENLQRTCEEYGIAYLYAQVLLAINRIRFTAAAPQTPFASLNVLLKSVELCRNHHYDLLLAEAHVVLAEVYIAMGKPQDAYSLINDQMPLVIEHGSVTLRGECFLVLAKTMLARIKRLEDGTNGEVGPAANKAMELLRASAEMFALVQNVSRLKEICYLQALIYNHMALQAERCGKDSTASCTSREEAAAMFLKRSSQLKRSAFVTIEPFFNLETNEKIRQVITHRSRELC